LRTILRIVGSGLAACLLGPMIFGSATTPPPYHQYFVEGFLQRPNAAPKQNFLVTLVARVTLGEGDTTIEFVLPNVAYPGSVNVSITDTSGHFWLSPMSHYKADSLAIRVVAVDRPDYLGAFVLAPAADFTVTGKVQGEESGCRACSADPTSESYVVGYQYHLIPQTCVLPN
jgi:hypothetical protein